MATVNAGVIVKVKSELIQNFLPLIEQGAVIRAHLPCTFRELLCNRLGIDEDYADNRIQTVFHNGKAVDDMDTTRVEDGDRIALSAAMPGLVGATFRRGGTLAGFRQAVTEKADQRGEPLVPENTGKVTLKLFNLVLKELGPALMAAGIEVQSRDLLDLLSRHRAALDQKLEIGIQGTESIGLDALLTKRQLPQKIHLMVEGEVEL
jgi:hypothetical protein